MEAFFRRIFKWWEGLNHFVLSLQLLLSLIGLLLVISTTPTLAHRLRLAHYYFVYHHSIYILLSLFTTILIAALPLRIVFLFCWVSWFLLVLSLVFVLLAGDKIQGAQRWIKVLSFSLQPSELIKPFFVVINAFILVNAPTKKISIIFSLIALLLVGALVALQPDIGMTTLIAITWAAQIFIYGVSGVLLIALAAGFFLFLAGAFFIFPHVKLRIIHFINSGESFQNSKAVSAIINGGWWGRGLGEGKVKVSLPDAHTDFVIAAITEELGLVSCIALVFIFLLLFFRIALLTIRHSDELLVIASAGLLIQLALQTIINFGVVVNLMPTTGMTMPFISYGGSSLLASGINIGLILSFARPQRSGHLEVKRVRLRL